ncbi:hypothetical protein ABIC78_000470 [Novosphingobium sp. 1529]|uniref:aminopeptidase n=1 Tax=Novosphingobium sp. 1529 TaxID=3156424 RepID=UPI003399BC3A
MLGRIAAFEIRYQLRSPVFWVVFALFFLLAFGAMASSQISIGGTPDNAWQNGTLSLAMTQGVMTIFALFSTTAFVANVIVRDDDSGFGPLVRATSVRKGDYLFGRFAGAYLVSLLVFAAVPLGSFVGSLMPWLDPETIGPNRLGTYLRPFVLVAMPTLLWSAAFFFAVATLTRSMMATYVAVVASLLVWGVTRGILSSHPDLRTLAALTDPFGVVGIALETRYWTLAEINAQPFPFSALMMENRAIWLAVTVAALALAWWRFSFATPAASKRQLRREARRARKLAAATPNRVSRLPDPDQARAQWPRLIARITFEARMILRSPAFLVLVAVGAINALAALSFSDSMYGSKSYPATFLQIMALRSAFTLGPIVIAGFYAGELVWRDRERRISAIIDASALPSWALLLPKVLALVLVLFITVALGTLVGIGVQLANGFTAIALGQYLWWYLVPTTADMVLLAGLAVFLQVVSPSKYVGWGLLLVWFVFGIVASAMHWDHPLYQYASSVPNPLTDINGARVGWATNWWLRLYSGLLLVALMAAAHLLWPRGANDGVGARSRQALRRLRSPAGGLILAALAGMAATGAWLYYQMDVRNHYENGAQQEIDAANLEKLYARYEYAPEPSVTHIALKVRIDPATLRMDAEGTYDLVNSTGAPLSTVHLMLPQHDRDVLALTIDGARVSHDDDRHQVRFFTFDRPLAPGATTRLHFRVRRWQQGINPLGDDTRLLANGTFLDSSEIAPTIGIQRAAMLSDPVKRREHGLPAEHRMPKLEDQGARRFNYIANASWVTSDITVTTAADQVPLAPGDKVADAVAGGQRTARFVSRVPILNFWSIQSARYAIDTRDADGVQVSIYYDPHHAYNVARLQRAASVALGYYRRNFGPYQFGYARIVEFPGYASFAQAFAGTMPFSESIGFLGDFSDPDKIDYATYVAAHELSHQYWAHQEISAEMQGGTMMVETLAQYSALMVMKQLYGPDKIRRFLRYELDRYLSSRGREAVEEVPLARVEDQPYIHYRKGAVALYLLQDRLGEARVNAMLRQILARYRFQGPPYSTSMDLVRGFHALARTPQEHALVRDLLETITVWDFKADSAKTQRRADGTWQTTLTLSASMARDDGKGTSTPVPLDQDVDIGLFTAQPGEGAFGKADVITMERHRLHDGTSRIVLTSRRKPAYAGVDPYNTFIDRKSDDNVIAVTGG